MRKEYGIEIRKYFHTRMRTCFPDYQEIKGKLYQTVAPGYRLYRKQQAGTYLFLYLTTASRQNEFTVELAWSPQPEFPIWNPGADVDFTEQEGRFRLGALMAGCRGDHWWTIQPPDSIQEATRRMRELDFSQPPVEKYLANVYSMVDDAISKIETMGLPAFESLLKIRSQSAPSEADINAENDPRGFEHAA